MLGVWLLSRQLQVKLRSSCWALVDSRYATNEAAYPVAFIAAIRNAGLTTANLAAGVSLRLAPPVLGVIRNIVRIELAARVDSGRKTICAVLGGHEAGEDRSRDEEGAIQHDGSSCGYQCLWVDVALVDRLRVARHE